MRTPTCKSGRSTILSPRMHPFTSRTRAATRKRVRRCTSSDAGRNVARRSTSTGPRAGGPWGPVDGVERWGLNVVASIVSNGENWNLLRTALNSPAPAGEAHLSSGDSGGGLFILQNGLWRLAGINYAVDDVFTAPDPQHGLRRRPLRRTRLLHPRTMTSRSR